MPNLLAALAPVFLAILLGWAARVSRVVPETAWPGVNRLVYMVMAPAYMFWEVAHAELTLSNLAVVGAGVIAFIAMGLAGFALLPALRQHPHTFASAHQGVLRWNAFVILAAAGAALGKEGSGMVALLMGPTIPVVNIFTVSVHARWGEGQSPDLSGILKAIVSNPLIVASVLGVIVNLSGFEIAGAPADLISIIGRGALGVMLMCVGAGLNLAAIGARPVLMGVTVAMRLLLGPAVFMAAGLALGVHGLALATLALIGGSPSPPAAYILTREMGGDPRFMAGHITATTLLSAITIPLALAVAHWLG